VSDHGRRRLGDETIDVVRIGQIRLADLDFGGQRRGRFALGGSAEIGRDDVVTIGHQSAYGLRSDQTETACDKNLFGHRSPYVVFIQKWI